MKAIEEVANQILAAQQVGSEQYIAEQTSGDLHSVKQTTDGRIVAVVDSDILASLDTSVWDKETINEAKEAAMKAMKAFGNGFYVNGVRYFINKDSRREYAKAGASEYYANHNTAIFADKMRAASVTEDMVKAAVDWKNDGKLTHERDDFVDFTRGNVLLESFGAQYSGTVLVGITKKGDLYIRDLLAIEPTAFEIKEEAPTTANANESPRSILGASTDGTVAQAAPDVNCEQDSTRTKPTVLTEEQMQKADLSVYEKEIHPDCECLRGGEQEE